MRHEPTFFCSSLLKSELTWLHPEVLEFETTPTQTKLAEGNIWTFLYVFRLVWAFAWFPL